MHDDTWPPPDPGPGRLVITLGLEDGTPAYYVAYGSYMSPERQYEPLRSFGWDGQRSPDGHPVVHAVELLITVQPQFQLGLGDVATVMSVNVAQQVA